ncbi:hypothetical protein [Mucilaginibacter gotjawali]|uniref:hypothetical protein n=1 Tax=Mucilaginibacter gotjawali TaxID=1550579 RepID=UPI0018D517F8|nr:hypothetical protein [Mucilaginibacter gotjawali]
MIAKTFYKLVNGRILLPGLFFFIFNTGAAQIVLPACFTDNMVLQQQTKVNLWGTETAGKPFTIVTSWNSKTYKVSGDANGNWQLKINTPVYGGPIPLHLMMAKYRR